FIQRVAPAKPKHAVSRAPVQVVLRLDPARVHVDCPGSVREDVPSDGFLGEGFAGENDRLKRGLKSRTPTIPLRGLRGCGGGDGVGPARVANEGDRRGAALTPPDNLALRLRPF